MEIKLNVKKLDDIYVLVKRRSKTNYFYRGPTRRATPYANRAMTFPTLTEAQTTCLNANQGKHRPFYKVKTASLYFANRWVMNYSEYSSNPTVEIQNSPTLISENTIKQQNLKESLRKQKEETLYKIKRNVESSITRLEQAKNNVVLQEAALQNQKDLIDKLSAFDYEGLVEANKTESERTAELLYGKA